MRKVLKILHSLAACGLIGGLLGYMILLLLAPQGTVAAYADMRQSIVALCDFLLLPSLGVVLVSGLFSMAVHTPFLDQGWAWIKAGMGIFVFKSVLTVIGASADYAAAVTQSLANGEVPAQVLEAAQAREWYTLGAILVLSVANVVLGVWRPRLARRPRPGVERVRQTG